MSEKIVEAVARAIEKSILDGFEIGDVLIEAGDGKHRVDGVIGMADIARAAIEAYEAEKRISVSTAYYFNGIPVSDLNREQQEGYLAYMKKLVSRL